MNTIVYNLEVSKCGIIKMVVYLKTHPTIVMSEERFSGEIRLQTVELRAGWEHPPDGDSDMAVVPDTARWWLSAT